MNTWNVKKNSGFTLVEVMIVVVIVAILIALAYPSYAQYIRKAKRGEAQHLLLNWSINQEIWRSNNPEYATLLQLQPPTHDHYNFNFSVAPTVTAYTLQATAAPGNDQLNDVARDGTPCAALTLDQSGVKVAAACWD